MAPPRKPTQGDRIAQLEAHAEQLASTSIAIAVKLENILDRLRAVESTSLLHGAELGAHNEQISKLTEISDLVVRLEERSLLGARSQQVVDDMQSRLVKLETMVSSHLPQTQRAAAGAAGGGAFVMVAVMKLLEMAHIIPPGTVP